MPLIFDPNLELTWLEMHAVGTVNYLRGQSELHKMLRLYRTLCKNFSTDGKIAVVSWEGSGGRVCWHDNIEEMIAGGRGGWVNGAGSCGSCLALYIKSGERKKFFVAAEQHGRKAIFSAPSRRGT